MALVQLKSYLQYNRELKKWVKVTPPPVDFRIDVYRKKAKIYKINEQDKQF